jgi:fatty acid desaturase
VGGKKLKRRSPLVVVLLIIVTFGLYFFYWWYVINRQLRDVGRDVEPLISLAAVTIGVLLVVPPFVSIYNTARRIARTQSDAGSPDPVSPMLVLVLEILAPVTAGITGIIGMWLIQSNLNAALDALASSR